MVPVQEYNSEWPEGTIFQQNPRAGRTVKEGQKLTLKISLGTEWVKVPETAGSAREDAEATLKSQGLTVQAYPVQDSSVAVDTVLYTVPAAGETVEGGTTVAMYVAQAKIVTERQVPSVTGLSLTDALTKLTSMNLVPRQVEAPSSEPQGTVLSQSPAPGTQVRMGTTITITISSGISQAELDAQAAAAAAEQQMLAQQQAQEQGWYEQDENGNWYHVGPDGQPD